MNTRSPQGVFIHPAAINESPSVGSGTRIWAFAHVLPGARIGADCNICDHVFIENDVMIGDRVTVKCGVQLWDGLTIQDDVFIGPNATFANDPFPRSRQPPEKFTPTIVRHSASIGANVTVLPGVTIGQGAMVGAGSVVTRDVPPHAVVYGNPARIRSYSPQNKKGLTAAQESRAGQQPHDAGGEPKCSVVGVEQVMLPQITDLRGNLSYAEIDKGLPFVAKRYFVVYGVPSPEVRGEHAHRTLHQFLVVLHGQCRVAFDDGTHRWETLLASPQKSIHVSPMVWNNLYEFTADCVLLVLASAVYDEADYIRNYDDFIAATREGK